MAAIHLEDLSPFGRSALKVDGDFAELAQLSGQIESLDLESDSDLDRAVKLLGRFVEHGQSLAQDMQEFSRSLEEARDRSEALAKTVGERAQRVQERRAQRNRLQERLLQVEQDIKTANESLVGGVKDESVKARLAELQAKLGDFIAAGQAIKEEAAQLKFKSVQRSAQSMLDTLQALRRKLETILSAN